MKIAVTSQNRKAITGHAGKCRKFWLYDVDGIQIQRKQLIELALEQSFHEVAHASPVAAATHPLDGIQLLIAGGLGRGLQNRLKHQGIEAIATAETDPDQAVAAWLAGTLVEIDAEAHEGGGHDHHHDDHQEDVPHRSAAVFVAPAHVGRFSPATLTPLKLPD
jgi:predicted Fe-Mo cluster-binding NifX family protein